MKRLLRFEWAAWALVAIYFLVASFGYLGKGSTGDAFKSTLVAMLAVALMGKSIDQRAASGRTTDE